MEVDVMALGAGQAMLHGMDHMWSLRDGKRELSWCPLNPFTILKLCRQGCCFIGECKCCDVVAGVLRCSVTSRVFDTFGHSTILNDPTVFYSDTSRIVVPLWRRKGRGLGKLAVDLAAQIDRACPGEAKLSLEFWSNYRNQHAPMETLG